MLVASDPKVEMRHTGLDLSTRPLRVVIVGHVDHGKSTLIGRLLHDTGSVPASKFEQIRAICQRRRTPFEWAFLVDAFQAERDQNITIEVSHIWFRSPRRQYVIIDAPGHKEFLKNMITGAATADAALLLIAADEGVQEQSRRHIYLLSMLGIRQLVVLVNKMDLVDYAEQIFCRIESECRNFLAKLGLNPICFIPVSARDGTNLSRLADRATPWYGAGSLLDALDRLKAAPLAPDAPLRFAVQDVYRFDHRRIVVGRIESGRLRVGDRIIFAPGNKESTLASIERWNAPAIEIAQAGASIGITLNEQVFVERGHIGSHESDPPIQTNRFKARIFWMGVNPLAPGKRYKLKLLTQEVECGLASVERVVDASSLESSGCVRTSVARNEVAEVTIQTRAPIVLDNHDCVAPSGRFVLVDEHDVAGGGIVFGGRYVARARIQSRNISWSDSVITRPRRTERNRHPGMVVWLTGLSGAGKSTIARALERELFEHRMQVYVLDGDNIRHGLNANLSFAPRDREENIRRVAEVAKLMADAGLVVICSFISPYRVDRVRARETLLSGGIEFIEVHVAAPLTVCEQRDPRGLYQKARAGEIRDFTGVDAPYEQPENPEIRVQSDRESVEESVERLLEFLIPRLQMDDVEYEI